MSKSLFRQAVLEADATAVKLSFASELPVLRRDKRGKYWEVLSHAPGDANLGLLNRSGIVLQDHDETREIGDVVKNSAKVDSDKKTRAQITLFDDAGRLAPSLTLRRFPSASVTPGYRNFASFRRMRMGL